MKQYKNEASRYTCNMSNKQKAVFFLLLFGAASLVSSCASKNKCNTRSKTKVEMGWM
jgi:tartrate dehydratase beta subunit/fumarate hydratase class I family protein